MSTSSSSATIGIWARMLPLIAGCCSSVFSHAVARQEPSVLRRPSSSGAMVSKRKRGELSDSDSDEITPGKQILPVANLPHDFDQEPQDGMQYLFLVRRDARRLPHVTRVSNPYEVTEPRVAHTLTPPSTNVLPCEKWRVSFQRHFSNLRMNVNQAAIYVDHAHSGSGRRVIPEKKDRDAWWKFLAGHPESAWCPRAQSARKKPSQPYRVQACADPAEAVLPGDATSLREMESSDFSQLPIACFDNLSFSRSDPSTAHFVLTAESSSASYPAPSAPLEEAHGGRTAPLSPPEVTPNHLKEIDHRMSIHLLMYFTHWIDVYLQNPSDPRTAISVSHGRWMFALLAKIEDQLSADEMNLLRKLARACLGLIQRHRGAGSVPTENATHMSDASCWMVFTAVAVHWGQRDLWADAETTLAGA